MVFEEEQASTDFEERLAEGLTSEIKNSILESVPQENRDRLLVLITKHYWEASSRGFKLGYDHGWHDGQQNNERIA